MQAQTIIVFAGTFLFSFLALALVFISPIERMFLKDWLTSGDDGGKKAAAAAEAIDDAKNAVKKPKSAKEAPAAESGADQSAPDVPEPPVEGSPEDILNKHAEATDAEPLVDLDAEVNSAQMAEAEYDEEIVEKEGSVRAAPEDVKDARVAMMKFLEGALAGLMKDGMRLDGVNKFGCHLFLAGAAEAQSRLHGLTKSQFVGVLEKCVAVLGTDKKMARQFGKKYEEYLLEPKYCDMFRAGAAAMERFNEDEGMNTAATLASALDEWNTSADKAEAGAPMAVVFTDIVGSTKLTQDHGDAAMQKIVRAHNKIVRDELRNFAGVEVKHTGDGIMASFKNVGNSVGASLEMMKNIDVFNGSERDIKLQIRIGINAGSPIQEDGDLFGTTVQISARLCDKAEDGGIAVSNLVRELSAGVAAEFETMGDMDLKGVGEAVEVYRVLPK
jgi:adenylate cyclase